MLEFYKKLQQILNSNYDKETNPSIYSGIYDLGFKFNGWDYQNLLSNSNELWTDT